MPDYLLYHANCPDGFASRVAAEIKLGPTATYLPVSYGQPCPLFSRQIPASSRVWIVDFSYSRSTLRTIADSVKQLVVLDHHKTAAEDLKDCEHAHFDMDKAGCQLTWQHFFPREPMPRLFEYIAMRDLGLPWNNRITADCQYPNWEHIHLGLWRATPRTFDAWLPFVRDKALLADLATQGSHIAARDRRVQEAAAKNPIWIRFDHHPEDIPATCSVPKEMVSDTLALMLANFPSAGVAAWWTVRDDGLIEFSLRSRKPNDHGLPAVDVSALAQAMDPPAPGHKGGGGHPQAAGFTTAHPITFA